MFFIEPIEMIQDPNYYSIIEDNQWVITSNNAVDLWGRLIMSDSLGDRPYITNTMDQLKVEFLRSDKFATNVNKLTNTPQTIEKVCTPSTVNRSLFKISLTATDAKNILSGSIRFNLLIASSSKTYTWVFNYAIKKELTDAGF
jgi:hypothetical protein